MTEVKPNVNQEIESALFRFRFDIESAFVNHCKDYCLATNQTLKNIEWVHLEKNTGFFCSCLANLKEHVVRNNAKTLINYEIFLSDVKNRIDMVGKNSYVQRAFSENICLMVKGLLAEILALTSVDQKQYVPQVAYHNCEKLSSCFDTNHPLEKLVNILLTAPGFELLSNGKIKVPSKDAFGVLIYLLRENKIIKLNSPYHIADTWRELFDFNEKDLPKNASEREKKDRDRFMDCESLARIKHVNNHQQNWVQLLNKGNIPIQKTQTKNLRDSAKARSNRVS